MYLRTNEYAKGAGRNPKADLSGINGKQGAASGEKQLQRGKLSLSETLKSGGDDLFPRRSRLPHLWKANCVSYEMAGSRQNPKIMLRRRRKRAAMDGWTGQTFGREKI